MDLKERVLIVIDPETETYSADYGMGGGVNMARLEAVLATILEEIRSGSILKKPGINHEVLEDDEVDTD